MREKERQRKERQRKDGEGRTQRGREADRQRYRQGVRERGWRFLYLTTHSYRRLYASTAFHVENTASRPREAGRTFYYTI